MATAYEIPTSASPTTQTITLNGTLYQITLTWCPDAGDGTWIMNVADQNGVGIAQGIPLVTGADLLAQLAYLGIGSGGGMVVQSDNDPTLVPSYSTMGSTGHLFFVSPT